MNKIDLGQARDRCTLRQFQFPESTDLQGRVKLITIEPLGKHRDTARRLLDALLAEALTTAEAPALRRLLEQ